MFAEDVGWIDTAWHIVEPYHARCNSLANTMEGEDDLSLA
jgi:hypothetical protein